MECLSEGTLTPEELGVAERPCFSTEGFDVVADSAHNADLGIQLLDAMIHRRGIVDLRDGARKFGRRLARDKGRAVLDPFVYTAFGRNGWMVPNQYWTPGVLAPMAAMGRYYMYYGNDFTPPRSLGNLCAGLMRDELMLDNLGFCRFHRAWAQDMIPTIIESLYGLKDRLLAGSDTRPCIASTAATPPTIGSRSGASTYVHTFLKRKRDVEKEKTARNCRIGLPRFDSTSKTRPSPSGTRSTAA